jgi:hypothetical protein
MEEKNKIKRYTLFEASSGTLYSISAAAIGNSAFWSATEQFTYLNTNPTFIGTP